eukprot:11779-Eustigmatos_ZCMA.PRE.1
MNTEEATASTFVRDTACSTDHTDLRDSEVDRESVDIQIDSVSRCCVSNIDCLVIKAYKS